MNTETIQRQYDEVIAPHYDLDPHAVIGGSLDRAADQLERQELLRSDAPMLRVLDLGIGTGRFLAKLRKRAGDCIVPFGLDLSEKMIDLARQRIPDLTAEVDDAANLDARFSGQVFDLICTHFITGFVPVQVLAPKIWSRLDEGGYWSLVGGTKAGFPTLQAQADRRSVRWMFGSRKLSVDDMVCNPAGRDEVAQILQENGFALRQCETFEPKLCFRNLTEFMDFGYRGGWLTPFIESLGLPNIGAVARWVLNTFIFPIHDHHSIEIVLAQKVTPPAGERPGRGPRRERETRPG
jgi:SAM-dependent methyltransferase